MPAAAKTPDDHDIRRYEMLRCGTPKPMKRAAESRPKFESPEPRTDRPSRSRSGRGSS